LLNGPGTATVHAPETIIKLIAEEARPGNHVLIMSNKAFDK